jgi:hypothetical protein
LQANARVDDADKIGWTACHAAAYGGHRDVLSLRLARQPNLAIATAFKETALCCTLRACASHGGRSALMLLEDGASLESVICGSLTSTAAILALINRGIVVREIVGSNGTTPPAPSRLFRT